MTRHLILIAHVFISATVFSQAVENDVIIVAELYSNSEKTTIAIKPRGSEILIDTDYDLNTRVFNKTSSVDSNEFPHIRSLSGKGLDYLKFIQNEIDAIDYCDYFNPIFIIYGSELIEWKRVVNCYPKSAEIVEKVDTEVSDLIKKYDL